MQRSRKGLDDWLAGWLTGWLVGWLAGWLAGRLVGWMMGRGSQISAPPFRGLEQVGFVALLAHLLAKCAAMSQPANLKSFTAMVNRLFVINLKPNQAAATQLFDDCIARERNFAKRFNNDQSGSSPLVQQVVLRCQPHLCLRDNNTNKGKGKGPLSPCGLVEGEKVDVTLVTKLMIELELPLSLTDIRNAVLQLDMVVQRRNNRCRSSCATKMTVF